MKNLRKKKLQSASIGAKKTGKLMGSHASSTTGLSMLKSTSHYNTSTDEPHSKLPKNRSKSKHINFDLTNTAIYSNKKGDKRNHRQSLKL